MQKEAEGFLSQIFKRQLGVVVTVQLSLNDGRRPLHCRVSSRILPEPLFPLVCYLIRCKLWFIHVWLFQIRTLRGRRSRFPSIRASSWWWDTGRTSLWPPPSSSSPWLFRWMQTLMKHFSSGLQINITFVFLLNKIDKYRLFCVCICFRCQFHFSG